NADPRAIMVAEAAWSLSERLGMPECRITLAQCAVYLALAPKSNASYSAIDAALEDVREGRTVPVPVFLRDGNKVASVGTARDGRGYEYSHDAARRTSIGGVTEQDYLGVDRRYYEPEGIGAEKLLKERLEEVRRARESGREQGGA
ncbi:MAG: replication-associated recombination protein A, partial [Planctomycetes bacterium]|nr:replication-associated recombination protein A [Planctomycetota bacterium]